MKRNHVVPFFAVILIVVAVGLMAFAPFQATPPPVADASVLTSVVGLIAQFGALAGVAALIAAVINVLKLTPLVNDNNTGPWYAGLSLLAFGTLVYFHVFKDIDLLTLNAQAAQIAGVLLFVGAYMAQLGLGQLAHAILKRLNIPGISTSFGAPGSPPATPPAA